VIGTNDDQEITIDEDPLPLGPVTTPSSVQPTPETTPATVPVPASVPDEEIILDEEIPLGPVDPAESLPQTGEASPAPYYITGLAIAGVGLLLSRTAKTGRRKR
jgi:LPXTG-motif cell wall-anchored protein